MMRSAAEETFWQISPDLLSVSDRAGIFVEVNPAWLTILGWSIDELIGKSFIEFLHPDDMSSTQEVFKAVLRQSPALHFENRYRHKDGSYRWLSWTAVLSGNTIISSARDVSTVKEQASRLHIALQERERTWNLSQDLLVIARMDGTLVAVNRAWTRLLGWTEQELIGSSFMSYVFPDDLAGTLEVFAGIQQKPLSEPYEYRFQCKDGSYKWFAWTAAFEDGQVYANGRDTNTEHEHAAALARSEASVRQLQKMEAVGQLTSGIAHDFNNLLGAMSGSLDLIKMRIAQGRHADLERYIIAATTAVRRAAALTHRLLAFSRQQTLDPISTSLNRLVAGMEDLIRRSVGPQISVEVVAAVGLWNTFVDVSQLENALLNLCINARDAMPSGGQLTIETANRWLDERAAADLDLPSGQYVSMCVSDNGSGMTPEVIARAFDPFFTTKPAGSGSGLGLSMVYGFARQSGGHVRIYSEVGTGTMVCIYLPRHMGAADVVTAPVPSAYVSGHETDTTILVVEDEHVLRMLIIDVLHDLGYKTIEAADGPSGLEILQSDERIDLLVSDVGLPGGMNGRQMVETAMKDRAGLKVLFITGYAENAVFSHEHLAPGMQVMTKPFDLVDFSKRVKNLIDAP